MKADKLEVGDIVQVDPKSDNESFRGCLVVVDEVRTWGIQGYVQNAGSKGQAYIRLSWNDIENTGGNKQPVLTGR